MAGASLSVDRSTDTLVIALAGDWLLGSNLPPTARVLKSLRETMKPCVVSFDATQLGDWDTGLIIAIIAIERGANTHGLKVNVTGLPDGPRQLVKLAFAVKEREGVRRRTTDVPFLETLGNDVLDIVAGSRQLLTFTGQVILSFGRFTRGQAAYRRADLAQFIQEAGAGALPIVSLISFLIGMIFAFVGVMQLDVFGVGVYTANLVAVAMVREMAAIMTAIVMAGRTGAAYAAEIGTMKVNQEIDALTTLGINPIDFLVTPRMIALVIMMPLLTMYASLMGILGGALVGVTMLDISLLQYAAQTIESVTLCSLFGGLFKSAIYGGLVALAGCQQGMACGDSAMAVGQCTTKAVVMGIVLIVVSASVLTVIYINLGI